MAPSRARCSRTAPSAASGCCQKGATLKAKTLSKRRSPRSASSSAMASSTALPASTCSRFLRVAISIILGERSIAVIVPVVSLSQTRETATPWPQPTSSRRSAGRTSRVPTAQTNRSDALSATAPAIASRAREARADLCEDVGDGSAAEDGGTHRFDGERCGEEPLARAQNDRMDNKAVLVDQPGLDQRSRKPCPTLGEQVSAGALLLEPCDGVGQVSGGDRRLAPVGGPERVRKHDLRDLVHRFGERTGGAGPVGGPLGVCG